ncbi:hypothetical protein F2P81_002762 [Scophthalmus maximus]|uniref:Uncharacterized protein n=1 Tax=Scophthalmus maximus TaxID=52904 RepID=A0A6A4TJM0_SCOMX|nr:hypothetical protein F2P81_002762 [Scophthalmus maximus]
MEKSNGTSSDNFLWSGDISPPSTALHDYSVHMMPHKDDLERRGNLMKSIEQELNHVFHTIDNWPHIEEGEKNWRVRILKASSDKVDDPPDGVHDELLTEYIIRAVVLFVVVLASKKRDELLMTTDKNERGEYEKKKKKLKIYFEGSCRVLRLHQEA